MICFKVLVFAAILFIGLSTTFISHTYDLPKKLSDNSNIIDLHFLEKSAFDFRYETECKECKCFIKNPTLSPELQAQVSFNAEIIKSFISFNRLYIIHKAESDQVKYSVFEIIPPKTLKEIIKEAEISSFKGFKDITFSPVENSFVGFSQGVLVIGKIDGQGSLQKNQYHLTSDQMNQESGEIYDIKYFGGLVFLAKGELGIKVIKIKEIGLSDLEIISLSFGDLELKEGSKITKLEIDSNNNILYAISSNNGQDCMLALDFSDKNEISLLNNYHFEGHTVINIALVYNHVHLISTKEDKSYYIQLSSVSSSRYDKLDLNKMWEIPAQIKNIHTNQGKILIDADKYLYTLTKDYAFETESSELLIDILTKKTEGNFFLFNQENSNYIISAEPSKLTLFSLPQSQKTLECGVFKPNYASLVTFKINLLQDSCVGIADSQDLNVCLESYKFDVEFKGTEFTEFSSNALAPTPLHTSNWEHFTAPLVNGTVKHEQSQHLPDSEKPQNNPQNPNNENNPTSGGEFPIRRPDLIEPDAPYYDRLNSTYALILVGIIILTCFGCLIKCLCDFVKISKDKVRDQFKHKPLEEDEEGQEDSIGGMEAKEEEGNAV